MDLCKQVVGPTWIANLMESLQNNSKIEHFLLGNNITSNEGGKSLKKFLLNDHKTHIKTLYLSGQDFNSQAISDVVDGLENDTIVEALWVKRNPIYAEGMKHIRRLLEKKHYVC